MHPEERFRGHRRTPLRRAEGAGLGSPRPPPASRHSGPQTNCRQISLADGPSFEMSVLSDELKRRNFDLPIRRMVLGQACVTLVDYLVDLRRLGTAAGAIGGHLGP